MFGIGGEESNHDSLELIVLPHGRQLPDHRLVRRFHPSWLYCRVHNASDQSLFIYGARHPSEFTTIPTSLFLLPPQRSTPKRWDCKGLLVPSGQSAYDGPKLVHGPMALKYRDMRRVTVDIKDGRYRCPRSNDVLTPGQLDFAIPSLNRQELLALTRRLVTV